MVSSYVETGGFHRSSKTAARDRMGIQIKKLNNIEEQNCKFSFLFSVIDDCIFKQKKEKKKKKKEKS